MGERNAMEPALSGGRVFFGGYSGGEDVQGDLKAGDCEAVHKQGCNGSGGGSDCRQGPEIPPTGSSS